MAKLRDTALNSPPALGLVRPEEKLEAGEARVGQHELLPLFDRLLHARLLRTELVREPLLSRVKLVAPPVQENEVHEWDADGIDENHDAGVELDELVLFRVAVEAVVDLQERAVVAVEEPARETVKDKRKRDKEEEERRCLENAIET